MEVYHDAPVDMVEQGEYLANMALCMKNLRFVEVRSLSDLKILP
jgi:hypothetical protein